MFIAHLSSMFLLVCFTRCAKRQDSYINSAVCQTRFAKFLIFDFRPPFAPAVSQMSKIDTSADAISTGKNCPRTLRVNRIDYYTGVKLRQLVRSLSAVKPRSLAASRLQRVHSVANWHVHGVYRGQKCTWPSQLPLTDCNEAGKNCEQHSSR